MTTATVTEYITRNVTRTIAASATASSTHRATPQGGILEGANPTVYDPKNPIIIFIIQAGIVIIFCRLLHWPLSKLRQPRVIAEVIGGILLGPSVMGRIPGFTNAIFPAASIPNFTLVANLGLVLFLFLVGLEVDLRYLLSNWKIAASVGLGGMALPFGLGCAISVGLYKEFHDDGQTVPIAFGTYMLFIAIAMAITAFPVLCRILTELKLLSTPVGVIVLSAGVSNDVVGWILLALCVALVNAGNGLTALYVLLVGVGWTLFMTLPVRWAFMWVLRRTRSLEEGPSQGIVALTLLLTFLSSFVTGTIGIHPIFGAFLAGLICPHEGGFAIKITEKIEDLVSTIFLPLYFALSGLSTNLGLLNSGKAWGYVVGVTATAFFAKIVGGSGAARLNGMVWRECFAIGALMSCKGLVELIVLNIGLNAKILSQRTFTIFVVMALITTFATTPLVSALYPPWYQKKLEAWKRGEIDWDTGRPHVRGDNESVDSIAVEKLETARMSRILVYLRLDSMPSMLALTALFGRSNNYLQKDNTNSNGSATPHTTGPTNSKTLTINTTMHPSGRIEMHGLRLLQLTERDSSVMKVSEVDEYSAYDPVVNTFRAFGRLNNVFVSGEVAVVPAAYYADTLASRAADMSSDLLLLPWSETGSMSEWQTLTPEAVRNRFAGGMYHDFVKSVFTHATCSVGIFINKGFGSNTGADNVPFRPRHLSRSYSAVSHMTPSARAEDLSTDPATINNTLTNSTDAALQIGRTHRIFLPYFGTADDRAAVRFVLQLAREPRLTVMIIHFRRHAAASGSSTPSGLQDTIHNLDLTLPISAEAVSRHKVRRNNSARGTSPTAALTEAIPLAERHAAFLSAMRSSLPTDIADRINVSSSTLNDEDDDGSNSANIARMVADKATDFLGVKRENPGDLIVVGRNFDDGEGCFGPVGDVLARRVGASLLVVRAAVR